MINVDDVREIVKKNEIKLDFERLNYDELLKEQGVDSLDMVTILFSIEEIYNIKINEEDIEQGRVATINSIVEFVNKKIVEANN